MKKLTFSLGAAFALVALGVASASATTIGLDVTATNASGASSITLTGLATELTSTTYTLTNSDATGIYSFSHSSISLSSTVTSTYTVASASAVMSSLAGSVLANRLTATIPDDTIYYPPSYGLTDSPVDATGILIELTSGAYSGDYVWIAYDTTQTTADAVYYTSLGKAIGGDNYVDYSSAPSTPEPSSLVLLGSGLLGAAFLLFRRNRTAKNAA